MVSHQHLHVSAAFDKTKIAVSSRWVKFSSTPSHSISKLRMLLMVLKETSSNYNEPYLVSCLYYCWHIYSKICHHIATTY